MVSLYVGKCTETQGVGSGPCTINIYRHEDLQAYVSYTFPDARCRL